MPDAKTSTLFYESLRALLCQNPKLKIESLRTKMLLKKSITDHVRFLKGSNLELRASVRLLQISISVYVLRSIFRPNADYFDNVVSKNEILNTMKNIISLKFKKPRTAQSPSDWIQNYSGHQYFFILRLPRAFFFTV